MSDPICCVRLLNIIGETDFGWRQSRQSEHQLFRMFPWNKVNHNPIKWSNRIDWFCCFIFSLWAHSSSSPDELWLIQIARFKLLLDVSWTQTDYDRGLCCLTERIRPRNPSIITKWLRANVAHEKGNQKSGNNANEWELISRPCFKMFITKCTAARAGDVTGARSSIAGGWGEQCSANKRER